MSGGLMTGAPGGTGAEIWSKPGLLKILDALPAYEPARVSALSKQLRDQGLSPEIVAGLLTQQRLRAVGETKFGSRAQRMLFTDAGVQQATRSGVARVHAARYLAAGCQTVADLTCGIGADALAFAQAGLRVRANDADPVTAAIAEFNLREYPEVRVQVGDALSVDLADVDGVFVDPARRNLRGRTFRLDDYSPSFSSVLQLRKRVPNLGVKVAPGIAHTELPSDVHAQWVSVDGSVVEAGLWFGALAGAGPDDVSSGWAEAGPTDGPGRSARVIRDDVQTVITATSNPREAVEMLEPKGVRRYLYEPDGAVIRAGAIAAVADLVNGAPISDKIAYLSSNTFFGTPLARAFEVVADLPFKQVGSYLSERHVGSVEILKRGTDIVPDQFRKSLKLRGTESASVILTRVLGKHRALIVDRLD